ncbi:MAG: retroviral-like aspartic protease family protein, partial [Planctomycetales bacterium]|nr:retroviral-like aspartic protease family protein [Planctomycetales bacterium]
MALVIWVILATSCVSGADAPGDAEQILTSHGLVQQGSHWVTADEARLAADLTDLRRLDRQHRQTAATLKRELQQAGQLRDRVVTAREEVDRLNALLDGGTLSGSRYNAVVDEVNRRADFINQHVSLLASPLGVVIEPNVAQAARQLVEQYGALSAALAHGRYTLETLEDSYAALAEDSQVAAALEQIDNGRPGDARLGPLRDYAGDARRLERMAATLWTAEIPLAVLDNRSLLPVVVEERVFGTFAVSSDQGISIVSSALAEAAGIDVERSVPPVKLQAFGVGEHELYPATIPRIRLGGHTVENVRVLVLPADAEEM